MSQNIGLLGGSFNPAHEGHLWISEKALRASGVDRIWWLVARQNPLKDAADMASFSERVNFAKRLVAHKPYIDVIDWEAKCASPFTIDVIKQLKKSHKTTKFIWIMGEDNLNQFHLWKRWADFLKEVPILIVSRGDDHRRLLASRFVNRFRHRQVSAKVLLCQRNPCWAVLRVRVNPLSSNAIRRSKGYQTGIPTEKVL